jgi:hypothetical protein
MSILGALEMFSPASAGLKLGLTPSKPANGGTFFNAEHYSAFSSKCSKSFTKGLFIDIYQTIRLSPMPL